MPWRNDPKINWQRLLTAPEVIVGRIRPGMRIFLGTGLAEPRTFVRTLMGTSGANLDDLELIQLVTLSDAISPQGLESQKFRLKTFFPGRAAASAITAGRVDLIPSRFGRVGRLFASGHIAVDVAVLQVTPPDTYGYCSLGTAVDVGRLAMAQAALRIGEIDPRVPRTLGDTMVHVSEFNLLMEGREPPLVLERPGVDAVHQALGAHLAALIEDRSCLAFSYGPLFEALGEHLTARRELGIHSPFFTDALMDLVKSGAVTNRHKGIFEGRSLASYAIGSPALMSWLDRNPLVEFQSVDKVCNPALIGRNPHFVAVYPAQAVDLSGRVVLAVGEPWAGTGAAEALDFCSGAEIAPGGRTIFALPSRDARGRSRIRPSVERCRHQFGLKGAVDMVVTEFGVADLNGRSVRERAQAIIDVAHPEDRPALVQAAKARRILYRDQIFLPDSGRLYPAEVATSAAFKGGLTVRFRPIRPSDEEKMRRLFYRFSDEAVYYRYFTPVRTMPHGRMQAYVNVDWTQVMSIVGLVGPPGQGRIIAEARYIREPSRPRADLVFVVDPEYQGLGIASYLYRRLLELAREQGLKGFTAEVLFSNRSMMNVFREAGPPFEASLEHGIYYLSIPFGPRPAAEEGAAAGPAEPAAPRPENAHAH